MRRGAAELAILPHEWHILAEVVDKESHSKAFAFSRESRFGQDPLPVVGEILLQPHHLIVVCGGRSKGLREVRKAVKCPVVVYLKLDEDCGLNLVANFTTLLFE